MLVIGASTMIREVSAQHLNLQTKAEVAVRDGTPILRTRHSMQRSSCWKLLDKNDMIDTVIQGWRCPPIYIIHYPELTEHALEGEDHVFDGAHKLEAVFEFMDDKFSITKSLSSCKDICDNDGKKFSELPQLLRKRIRDYMFTINMIDDETAHNPDRLRTLWERLNKAGKKLNSYELEIPVIRPLIERVLKPAVEQFAGSILFPPKKSGEAPVSQRGELEQRMQVILALCDSAEHRPESQSALISRWHTGSLGRNMAERNLNVDANACRWSDVLGRARAMLRDMEEFGVFHKDGEEVITDGLRKTELPFVLGRLTRAFPRIDLFRHQKEKILTFLRDTVFCKTADEMLRLLGGSCRDGRYQKKLVEYIDSEVIGIVVAQPRLFTAKQKGVKLRGQGGLCPLCSKKIEKHHVAEGDHIVAWSEGGDTTMENLQIVHRLCHQAKTAGSSSNAA